MNICPDGKLAEDGGYFLVIHQDSNEKSCFAMSLKEDEGYLIDVAAKQVHHATCGDARSGANSHTGAVKAAQHIDGSTDESSPLRGHQSMGLHRTATGLLPAKHRRL